MDLYFDLGYAGLFLASFLAATVIPFSSEGLFLVMLFNGFNSWWLLFFATTGNTLGGMSSYGIGRMGKWAWIEKWLRLKPESVTRMQHKIFPYASLAAFFCWLPAIGDIIAVALGLIRVSWVKVLFWMTIGKLFRYILLIFIQDGVFQLFF